MASVKKAPTKTFSRVKNHLAELQRWWPAYVKNDGVHGISVDPVLWRSDFSADPTIDDESRVAGIRVEAITDAGGDVSGTEPTIVISGSGTLDPRCTINHADGTSTIIHLIAPTSERNSNETALGSYTYTEEDGTTTSAIGWGDLKTQQGNNRGTYVRRGPFPVFMTVQELAELIDTYRHVGEGDEDKPAWLPHGIDGRTLSQTNPNPDIDADPRSSSDPMPTTSPYRATVFMPMMLDNNQFSSDISGAASTWAGPPAGSGLAADEPLDRAWNDGTGMTRYDSDPEGDDSATIKYKRVGKSGDHHRSVNSVENDVQRAVWTSADSSESPAPHYRMSMALACFLKDGTYSLNDGVLIPYAFDASRSIGGTTTDTFYMTWDGRDGFGDAPADIDEWCPAGVYPFFDFTQGPLTPRAQGTNWSRGTLDDHGTTNPLRYEVPPSASPIRLLHYTVTQSALGYTTMLLYVENSNTLLTDGVTAVGVNDVFVSGSAIFIQGITDAENDIVSPNAQTLEDGNLWGSRFDTRRHTGKHVVNGWWTIEEVDTTEQVGSTGATSTIATNLGLWNDSTNPCTRLWVTLPQHEYVADSASPAAAYVFPGRAGGPEFAYGNIAAEYTDDSDSGDLRLDAGSNGAIQAQNVYGIGDARYGYEAGMQGDINVPVTASEHTTYPGRPTIGEFSLPNAAGDYVDNRPVPRSIHICSLNVTEERNIPGAPPVITKGGGTLRIPAPIGHDLCERYISLSTATNVEAVQAARPVGEYLENGRYSRWTVRRDIKGPENGAWGLPENIRWGKWAYRGVSTPLWSFVDGNTGRHAWDYIKPVGVSGTWTYGRNRPWPAHERMGTRLTMEGGVVSDTTDIGLSEIGASPIHLDMTLTAFIPSRDNRLTIIEFDGGEAHPRYGRHTMLTNTESFDNGFGFVPLWDGIGQAGVYQRGEFITVSGASITTSGASVSAHTDSAIRQDGAAGGHPVFIGRPLFGVKAWNSGGVDTPTALDIGVPATFTNNRPAVWLTKSASGATGDWEGSDDLTLPGTGGFGRLGAGFGNGPAFTYTEGTHTLRTTFTTGGMTLTFDGTEVGTDIAASGPVWGMQVKAANLFAFPERSPAFISGTWVFDEYAHLTSEEIPIVGYNDDARPFTVQRFAPDGDFIISNASTLATNGLNYKAFLPVNPDSYLDSADRMVRADNPAFQVSNVDLQVDEVVLRQIPTPAMLPFTVDTVKQQVTGIDVARFTSLTIEADNVSTTTGMLVTVTLLEPPTVTTIDQEASTVISGFDDLDPQFIGGVGAIDLTGLPTSAITNGFVIRFNFYVPSTEDTSLHPVDWSKTPIVRSWSVYYDHTPTSDGTIIGNTYDGSTATTIGTSGTQTFTSKVGHIVSLRATGETDDPDRKIAHIKVDFGDGTVTDWLAVETPATSVTYDLSHVYSSMPSSGSTYDIVVYSRDDSENVSDASDILRVTMTAAEPVAVVRAVPSMVRAGQAIRFDGSDSYTVDTGATISTYTWTFGDGSTSVSGSAVYQDHTYAEAGEFMATLTITDSEGTDSPVSKSVVKVLPATLVVPLTLSTKPSAFKRNRSANLVTTPILDAVYPEVSDTGQRNDTFTLSGMFLKETMDSDVAFMEELLLSGALVEFEYQDVNFVGTADSKTFVGRLVSFDYDRRGGERDRTPYSATFVREAGLGA